MAEDFDGQNARAGVIKETDNNTANNICIARPIALVYSTRRLADWFQQSRPKQWLNPPAMASTMRSAAPECP